VKVAIYPAFFLWYAAAPKLFHRFMACVWHQQADRITLLIKDIDSNSAPDFIAHHASSSYWGIDVDSTHKDELLLIRADAADACALHHHMADLLHAAPSKRKMNPRHSPQNDLCSPRPLSIMVIFAWIFLTPRASRRFIDVHSRFGARISTTESAS
jgi:hypothetical protein